MKLLVGKSAVMLISLLGAVFCYLKATGTDFFCITQGCKIYSGYGLFGVSFYLYGLAGFALILILTTFYPRAGTLFWLPAVLALALALDSLFLFYQFLFWPCASCLAAGLLIGLTALAALILLKLPGRPLLWILSVIWLVLFGYVGLAAVKETVFLPWAIAGEPDAPIKVFFSPVCPACKETVTRILADPATAAQTAFFPIAKGERDEQRLAAFLHGPPEKRELTALFEEAPSDARLTGEDRRRLQMNKMALARLGASTVPLVVAAYLPFPSDAAGENPLNSPFAPPGGSSFAPPSSPPTPGCSAFEETPDCEPGGAQ